MMTSSTPISPAAGEVGADATADPYVADSYFTDGANLYRLIGWLSRRTEPALAELEDCRTLQCVLLERAALVRLRLRVVARA